MKLPILNVRGHTGVWFADVEGYGLLPCVHARESKAFSYRERPATYEAQTPQRRKFSNAIAADKLVVMTLDEGQGDEYFRTDYVGVFRVDNVVVDKLGRVSFDFIERVANCRKGQTTLKLFTRKKRAA